MQNNIRSECKIKIPGPICWDVLTEGWFDVSKIRGNSCKSPSNYGADLDLI